MPDADLLYSHGKIRRLSGDWRHYRLNRESLRYRSRRESEAEIDWTFKLNFGASLVSLAAVGVS